MIVNGIAFKCMPIVDLLDFSFLVVCCVYWGFGYVPQIVQLVGAEYRIWRIVLK